MSYTYEYPHPAVTVDVVVFTIENDDLKVLFIQRDQEPFKGQWAFPGGFVDIDERLSDAAKRELKEETGVSVNFLEQFYTFGRPDRDPRERIITVAYYALIPSDQLALVAGDDAMLTSRFGCCQRPSRCMNYNACMSCSLARHSTSATSERKSSRSIKSKRRAKNVSLSGIDRHACIGSKPRRQLMAN
jgi:8-oxo-dGTP diphosphatase